MSDFYLAWFYGGPRDGQLWPINEDTPELFVHFNELPFFVPVRYKRIWPAHLDGYLHYLAAGSRHYPVWPRISLAAQYHPAFGPAG